MRSVNEIVANRKIKQEQQQQQQALVSSVSQSANHTASQMADFMNRTQQDNHRTYGAMVGEAVKNVPQPEKPELSIAFNGLKNIAVEAATFPGLEGALKDIVAGLNALRQDVGRIQFVLPQPTITVPEIKLPTINVPEANVRVDIPPIKIDYPKLAPAPPAPVIPLPPPPSEPEVMEINYSYGAMGELESVTERYTDGTFKRAYGFNTNRVRIERG